MYVTGAVIALVVRVPEVPLQVSPLPVTAHDVVSVETQVIAEVRPLLSMRGDAVMVPAGIETTHVLIPDEQ